MLRRALNGLFLSRGFAEASLLAACWRKGSPCALASVLALTEPRTLPVSRNREPLPWRAVPGVDHAVFPLEEPSAACYCLVRRAFRLIRRVFDIRPAFLAILGILALIDMIAENAVIPTEQIEGERRAGSEVHEAVIEACPRFRPIMLAALRRSWRSFRSRRLR